MSRCSYCMQGVNPCPHYRHSLLSVYFLLSNSIIGEFLSRKYVIEYDKGSFRGKLIGHTPYGDTFLSFIKGEVIGNIYEDKYLLEGEK